MLLDSTIFHRCVVQPSNDFQTLKIFEDIAELKRTSGVDFMGKLLNENSIQDQFEDEAVTFILETSIGNKRADPFEWWRTNEKRYPNIALLSRDLLSIQASSVSGKHYFSAVGKMMEAHRTQIFDE